MHEPDNRDNRLPVIGPCPSCNLGHPELRGRQGPQVEGPDDPREVRFVVMCPTCGDAGFTVAETPLAAIEAWHLEAGRRVAPIEPGIDGDIHEPRTPLGRAIAAARVE